MDRAPQHGLSCAAWTELRHEGLHHKFLRKLVLPEEVQGEAVRGPPLVEDHGSGVQLKAEGAAAREGLGARGRARTHVIQAAAVLLHVACGRLRDLKGEARGAFCSPSLSCWGFSHKDPPSCPRRTPQILCPQLA